MKDIKQTARTIAVDTTVALAGLGVAGTAAFGAKEAVAFGNRYDDDTIAAATATAADGHVITETVVSKKGSKDVVQPAVQEVIAAAGGRLEGPVDIEAATSSSRRSDLGTETVPPSQLQRAAQQLAGTGATEATSVTISYIDGISGSGTNTTTYSVNVPMTGTPPSSTVHESTAAKVGSAQRSKS